MTIIGIDDTDSRRKGMCTTYVAARVAERLIRDGATVNRRLLVRLNPAVERKTRGNAALAIHTDAEPDYAFNEARAVIAALTASDDRTSPGLVVAAHRPDDIPAAAGMFYRDGLREIHELSDALSVIEEHGWHHAAIQPDSAGREHEGYGRIGATAAIGAWVGCDEWTYEHLSYRELDRCGTERDVDKESVFAAADAGYPVVWDTVDRGEDEPVCVPNAPGPILYGIRGDEPDACQEVANRIESEPVALSATYRTNQGTDAHIEGGDIGALTKNAGYAVDGIVVDEPETRQGGHTFVTLARPSDVTVSDTGVAVEDRANTIDCAAFEPTKRFRKRVRSLRPGDQITVTGEHEDGTLKLEKLAVRDLSTHELVTPTCPGCESRMESSGTNQGYRCRDCGTDAPGKTERTVERSLSVGWYEVPPCARRHVAKPLVRGGFDGPTHPDR